MAEEALNQEQEQQPDFEGVLPSILSRTQEEIEDREAETPDMEHADGHVEHEEQEQQEAPEQEQQEQTALSEDETNLQSWLQEQVKNPDEAPEWLWDLKVPTKVNGQPAEASFRDMVNSYQTQEAATQRLDEAKSQAKALHQEADEYRNTSKQELATASALVKLVEETVFKSELQQLEKLKQEHGSGSDEYQDAKDALTRRAQGLAKAKQAISGRLQEALKQAQGGPSQEDYAKAQEQLFERQPDLKDEGERQKLMEFAFEYGFTEEQLKAETNPLLFSLAYDAMRWRNAQAKAESVKEKVESIPRMLPPGPQRPRSKPKANDPVGILYGS